MNNGFNIPAHLFRLKQANDYWSMTPATYASRFIQEMEKRYGSRDRSWTFVGVEFHDDSPQVWFPGGYETPPRKHIAISLSASAFSDRQRTVYQLAHECVHLLAPVVGGGAPIIEEGLATAFSEDMIEEWCGNTSKQAYTSTQKYVEAAARVRELLALAPDAIPRLRAIEPAFNHMTADTFDRAGLNVPLALVTALLASFPKD
ncbi:TPA: hypothetical protein OOF41_004265 [Citrobacter freundii]|nr:hypothetical protein [Citrobacter freundii]